MLTGYAPAVSVRFQTGKRKSSINERLSFRLMAVNCSRQKTVHLFMPVPGSEHRSQFDSKLLCRIQILFPESAGYSKEKAWFYVLDRILAGLSRT